MRIEFSNDKYIASHGRAPRGYGSWAFSYRAECDLRASEPVFFHGKTLGDAKKAMREHIKSIAPAGFKGWVEVLVLP